MGRKTKEGEGGKEKGRTGGQGVLRPDAGRCWPSRRCRGTAGRRCRAGRTAPTSCDPQPWGGTTGGGHSVRGGRAWGGDPTANGGHSSGGGALSSGGGNRQSHSFGGGRHYRGVMHTGGGTWMWGSRHDQWGPIGQWGAIYGGGASQWGDSRPIGGEDDIPMGAGHHWGGEGRPSKGGGLEHRNGGGTHTSLVGGDGGG